MSCGTAKWTAAVPHGCDRLCHEHGPHACRLGSPLLRDRVRARVNDVHGRVHAHW